MFWGKRSTKALSHPLPTEHLKTIRLTANGFYDDERPCSPAHQMICVRPYDLDKNDSFGTFMRLCVIQILTDFSLVVERVYDNTNTLMHETIITDFLDMGGKIILPGKNNLLAVSGPQEQKLLGLIPICDLQCYAYNIYGYRQSFPIHQLLDLSTDFQKSGFSIRLYCHEGHDYFLLETAEDIQPYVHIIQTLCQKQGRKIVFE